MYTIATIDSTTKNFLKYYNIFIQFPQCRETTDALLSKKIESQIATDSFNVTHNYGGKIDLFRLPWNYSPQRKPLAFKPIKSIARRTTVSANSSMDLGLE